MIQFEWDAKKAAANLKKHDISFEEAKSVFYDEFAVQLSANSTKVAPHGKRSRPLLGIPAIL
jgi:uncharacterized DUF497 family protein